MLKKLLLAVLVAAPLCMNAQKFGYINTEEVFNVMPDVATAQTKLNDTKAKYDTELNKLQAELQKDYEELQKEAQDPKVLDTIKERHQKDFEDKYQKFENFRQQAATELQKQQEQLMAPIMTKISDAIKAVGAEGGYTFIFEGQSLLYHGTGSEDISAKVKAKLGIK